LYQLPAVAGTVNLAEIKAGYYGMIGRSGMVPKGPLLDFNTAHGRAERFA
jgi:putative glutathione S-transferase